MTPPPKRARLSSSRQDTLDAFRREYKQLQARLAAEQQAENEALAEQLRAQEEVEARSWLGEYARRLEECRAVPMATAGLDKWHGVVTDLMARREQGGRTRKRSAGVEPEEAGKAVEAEVAASAVSWSGDEREDGGENDGGEEEEAATRQARKGKGRASGWAED